MSALGRKRSRLEWVEIGSKRTIRRDDALDANTIVEGPNLAGQSPARSAMHDALAVFLGDWEAAGTSYGGTEQPSRDPKVNGVSWTSLHTGRWHTGEFFLIQDERAKIDGTTVFDTLSVLGVDPETQTYFARSFENHGFYRRYSVAVEGNIWTLTGPTERARTEFRDNDRTQVITWEWKPDDTWLPLCDRTAFRTD